MKWLKYGNMAILVIWQYGFKYGQYGCLWRKQQKCSNLAKDLNWSDLPGRNESKNASILSFVFLGSSFVIFKKTSSCAGNSEVWLLMSMFPQISRQGMIKKKLILKHLLWEADQDQILPLFHIPECPSLFPHKISPVQLRQNKIVK